MKVLDTKLHYRLNEVTCFFDLYKAAIPKPNPATIRNKAPLFKGIAHMHGGGQQHGVPGPPPGGGGGGCEKTGFIKRTANNKMTVLKKVLRIAIL